MASTTNLFGFEQIDSDSTVNTTLIFEEINKELEQYLPEKSIDTDLTDGVFDFLENLTNHAEQNFEELIGENTCKKCFVRALTYIFALLLNTKSTQRTKSKEYLKLPSKQH